MSRLRSALAKVGALALAATALTVVAPAANAACSTYYVSSSSGSDGNNGCSTSAPWQSLAKVNATTFTAGNQILFQDGGSWSGELTPQGSGASGNPVVISSYGSGSAPIIAGAGAAAAILLTNQQYWTIQNLEITNTTSSAALRSGIQLQNNTSGILNGIHIVNNNIHNVLGFWNSNASVQPSTSSGIAFNLSDSYSTNGWNDVLIQGNTLNHVDAGAVYIGSLAGSGHATDTSNVVIQNNTINDAGGNDIVCIFCASPLVQNNVATASGYRYSGAGLWMAVNTGGNWQYNEVSGQWREMWDGQAFDIDWDNSNVTLQYNYTHDNTFGFMEFCCSESGGATNSTVRYNISQNDGSNNAVFGQLYGATTTGTTRLYNNTVYNSNNAWITNSTPNGTNVIFNNNIIYKTGTGGYAGGATVWSHNLFYGNHPSSEPADSSKITSDPKLVSPGGAGNGRSTASAYQLQTGSPAIGAGTLISGNGGLDFFGNAVSSTAAPNIGAYNGSGTGGGTSSEIVNRNASSLCLDDYNWATADGSPVDLWTCWGGAVQQWTFTPVSGYYELVNGNSNKCLDSYGSRTPGTQTVLWTCWGGNNQLWSIVTVGSYFELVNRDSGFCLDDYNFGTSPGTPANIYTCTGSNAQQWSKS
ncbi:MAG TPA: RICIN domain-containing protein [Acidothermaceae bacterium]